jgi:hypothetical protein
VDVTWLIIAKEINMINFMQLFPGKQSCEVYSKSFREKTGVRCKRGEFVTKQYGFSSEKFFNAVSADVDAHPKEGQSGSIVNYHSRSGCWLFVSATKKGFSCREFQRQLGLSSYLNEFVYKLNRRYFGLRLFDRLVLASIYPCVQS